MLPSCRFVARRAALTASADSAETIETLAVEDPPNALRFREWCAIWEKCTRLEKGFWDASLHLL